MNYRFIRDLLEDFAVRILQGWLSSTTLKRVQCLRSTTHKGMCFPPSKLLIQGSHDKKCSSCWWWWVIKSQAYWCGHKSYLQLVFWELHPLAGLKFNSSMSQRLESWGSTAGNKHVYKVMGKKCLLQPWVRLSQGAEKTWSSGCCLKPRC